MILHYFALVYFYFKFCIYVQNINDYSMNIKIKSSLDNYARFYIMTIQ